MSTWRGHGGKLYVKSPQVELGIGKWTADESAVLANKTNSTSGGHKERQGTVRDTAISFEMPWDDTKDPDALGLHPGTSHALELQKGESGKKMTTTSFIIEKRSFVNDEDEDIVRLSVSGYSNAVMTHS